eukprot:5374357-Amphidinium_carterae.1
MSEKVRENSKDFEPPSHVVDADTMMVELQRDDMRGNSGSAVQIKGVAEALCKRFLRKFEERVIRADGIELHPCPKHVHKTGVTSLMTKELARCLREPDGEADYH